MTQKLHILFLCGWFPSRVSPTNGDFIERHAKAVATKHFVTLLHIITDKNATENIEIVSKKESNLTTHIAYLKKADNKLHKISLFIKAFFALLKKIDIIDVVHLNEIFPFGMFSIYLKWFQKKPYIISEHWTGYHQPQAENISFFQKLISKKITKNAAFVCPVSDNLKTSMQKIGLKGEYKKVPNVVDTDLFKPLKKETELFSIIHISNLMDVHKNISGMLYVAKELENKIGAFTWQFIGGTSKNYLQLINKLNFSSAKIEFINHIPQKKLVNHLQSSNVFTLFSNYENLPCVILESFSCGVPVISTNVGGIKEYFPKDFGELIEQNNSEKLLESLLYYYNNPEIDKNIMHNYAVEKFSKKVIANQFSELYFKALNNF
ncbi:glycosyltransferase family 4 protein [Polaribacter haliotis]|uniref:Glycosyltransferase family 4 protein n=1 Tax=Polaribacter haliotis TaxID=1888915 RepID=A0A7L8AJU2_9FLAO|nr:glycosyltransferase family 4 protein [Polaribacter haliotis]QOD62288.1 glycosyltransferase family 4 protein [Polaribacter haliotis]